MGFCVGDIQVNDVCFDLDVVIFCDYEVDDDLIVYFDDLVSDIGFDFNCINIYLIRKVNGLWYYGGFFFGDDQVVMGMYISEIDIFIY